MLARPAQERWRVMLWLIPLLWCATSAATLWTLHDRDAWVMPAVAVVALASALAGRASSHFGRERK
jgi:hypothetical protein